MSVSHLNVSGGNGWNFETEPWSQLSVNCAFGVIKAVEGR